MLQVELSPYIEGVKRTRIVNSMLKNVALYLNRFLKFEFQKLYIYAEGKFQALQKFKFKHLHNLDENEPLIVIYTELYILEHFRAQRKILAELGVNNNLRRSSIYNE